MSHRPPVAPNEAEGESTEESSHIATTTWTNKEIQCDKAVCQ